jgi:arylsulfatase A-like enzyme
MKPKPKPNLIMIVADDHRASALGRVGTEPVRTPHLDRLAGEGCHFPQLRIEGGRCRAVCIPTRASLLTGCSVERACLDIEGRRLREDAPFLPGILRQNGYFCQHIGKWHQDISALQRGFHHGRSIFTAGFRDPEALPVHDWEDLDHDPLPEPRILEEYASHVFTREAVSFIGEISAIKGDQPFFLHVALTLPHDPFIPPHGWREPLELPPLPETFLPEHPFDIGDLDVRDEQLLTRPLDGQAVRRMTAAYYALIEEIDRSVGAIWKAIEEHGLDSNTYLLYTGDHGLSGGRHGLLGKQNLYESAVRIPGILRGPGIPGGRVVDELVSQLDLAPSLLELLGVEAGEIGMQGISVKPQVTGESPGLHREHQFARYRGFQRMVTDGVYKLIATRVGKEPVLQLFGISRDPEERRNLMFDPSFRVTAESLVSVLNRWLLESNDHDFGPIDIDAIPQSRVVTS